MENKSPSINEVIEYGLDLINPDETVTVQLKDLLYIYKSLEEFIRFFHQPMHYQTTDDVRQYLGTKEQGAFSVMLYAYYQIFDRMFRKN